MKLKTMFLPLMAATIVVLVLAATLGLETRW